MLIPRDYQKAAIKAHFSYFQKRSGNPLFVVPTGGGKSLIIAEFCRMVVDQWPDQRILILTHVKELIEQNHGELVRQWGLLAPVGIYSAGLKSRETSDSVIFAGIQSVWPHVGKPSKAAEDLGVFNLVLIDEAHLVPKSGEGRYRGYLDWLKAKNPRLRIIGYTATEYRLEGGYLHHGEGRIFTDVAYTVKIEKLLDDGYLAPLVAMRPENVIDTSGIGTTAGDFKRGELQLSAMKEGQTKAAVDEMVSVARKQGRKHWLIFACGVEHGEEIVEMLRNDHDVDVELVLGSTKRDERSEIISRAKAGDITAIVNVGVLTTGFNWPRCDLLAVMRPTKSAALYVQMMGRGMRTFEGKDDCLVLDYGENVIRHGPVNAIRINDGKKGEPKAKACPECFLIVEPGVMICDGCGYEFQADQRAVAERAAKHAGTAGTLSPIDFTPPKSKEKYPVDRVTYGRHSKAGKPDSLKVEYYSGLRSFREWICLEHQGYAQRKAHKWWTSRGSFPAPATVSEALERLGELRQPSEIYVMEDGKYERVVDGVFKRQTPAEPSGSPEDAEVGSSPHDSRDGAGNAGDDVRPW